MSASRRLLLGLTLGSAMLAAASVGHASTLETLYTFTGGADGAGPVGDLILKDGMLYGATFGIDVKFGGCQTRIDCGTVFQFDLLTGTLTTLHRFTGGVDGANPLAGLAFDTTGVLYGTTFYRGGTSGSSGQNFAGFGTLFALDPATRTLKTLHTFTGGLDGRNSHAGLVVRNGLLYGTTIGGGPSPSHFCGPVGCGTAFTLDPTTQKLTTLHSFCALPRCPDGGNPYGGLVFDKAGMLYGTTYYGGVGELHFNTSGTVFQLDPATQALTTLHTFGNRSIGRLPEAGLVFHDGKLFGTTTEGGTVCRGHFCGTVFKLNPATKHLETLHAFTGRDEGFGPMTDLAVGGGELYGTNTYGGTGGGGNPYCCGVVFKLDLATKQMAVVHAFTGGADGSTPSGGVVLGSTGALYGSTLDGGKFGGVCAPSGCGTLFKLVP